MPSYTHAMPSGCRSSESTFNRITNPRRRWEPPSSSERGDIYSRPMNDITSHYGIAGLYESIVAALGEAGLDPDTVTTEDLGPVDEFHIGGRAATARLIEQAGFEDGSNILDIGSGVGGTARHLAVTGAHQVTGIDLTPEYVEVATALTAMVGLGDRASFRVADVVDLPFLPASFDAAVQLHVGMNIRDKAAAFIEVARVLRDGGVFAVYDIMRAGTAPINYPMPWAGSESTSHLGTSDQYAAALSAAGFAIETVNDRSDHALAFFKTLRERPGPGSPIGLHLMMGSEAPVRYGNMVKAVEDGAVSPVEIIATTKN